MFNRLMFSCYWKLPKQTKKTEQFSPAHALASCFLERSELMVTSLLQWHFLFKLMDLHWRHIWPDQYKTEIMSPSEYSSFKVNNTPGELWRRKGKHWDRKHEINCKNSSKWRTEEILKSFQANGCAGTWSGFYICKFGSWLSEAKR